MQKFTHSRVYLLTWVLISLSVFILYSCGNSGGGAKPTVEYYTLTPSTTTPEAVSSVSVVLKAYDVNDNQISDYNNENAVNIIQNGGTAIKISYDAGGGLDGLTDNADGTARIDAGEFFNGVYTFEVTNSVAEGPVTFTATESVLTKNGTSSGITWQVVPNVINVTVTYDDLTLDGSDVYVSSFLEDGNLPDDRIEEVSGTITGDTESLVLDNATFGYGDGTYELRAHIDVNGDGSLSSGAGNDYIALGTVTISGGNGSATLNGPWGTYFGPILQYNNLPVDSDGKPINVILVSQGDTWGNYTYGSVSSTINIGSPFDSMDGWGPFGNYTFLAVIDMDTSPDYTASTNLSWPSGPFPGLISIDF
jgi:hypothetical protein